MSRRWFHQSTQSRVSSSRSSTPPQGPRFETVNGLYKTELIRGPDQGPWKTIDQLELATLGWVHWWNTERLHGYCGDIPPAEYEEANYAQLAPTGR